MAALRVKESFTAFGREFVGGEIVASDELSGWPAGVMERRMAEGFLEASLADAPAAPAAPAAKKGK